MEETHSYEEFLELIRINYKVDGFDVVYDKGSGLGISKFKNHDEALDFYKKTDDLTNKGLVIGYHFSTNQSHYYFEALNVTESDLEDFSKPETQARLLNKVSENLAGKLYNKKIINSRQ